MPSTLLPGPATGPDGPQPRSPVRRLVLGRRAEPPWARPALIALLAATAVLYLYGLGASGWANSFYSAAVQAGATSWKAFFFGSSDAAGAITVDKTPGALWPMALTARIFGVGPWSILVPQALMGVGTVAVLYAAVRRALGGGRVPAGQAAGAALLAGAVLALTPVAALMFRFNNPDALLVLLLTLAAYGVVRAQRDASTGWLVFAGSCVGFGFLAKMLQAFLVVPAFGLVYLVCAPAPVRRRLWQLLLAGAAMVVSAGWWVAIVALVPEGSRPYIGGSQHNSVLELALGYNGLGRLTGDETGGLGNLDQDAGWGRLFGAELGGQVSWLLPAALILLLTGLWATRRSSRDDPARAALLLWGGWLLVTGLVFSFMQGIFHAYYAVALAPAIAALVGIGAVLLWSRRHDLAARGPLAGCVAVTAWWAYTLLGRAPDWNAWLRPAVLIGGVAAAALLAASGRSGRVLAVAGALAVTTSIAGPAAYALDTASSPHTGAIPSAGPATGGPGGMGRPGAVPGGGRGGPGTGPAGARQGAGPGAGPGAGTVPGRAGGAAGFARPPGQGQGRPMGMRGPGAGGLLDAGTPSAALTTLLKQGAGSYTWVAAAIGSNNAAGYQLATGEPVMAVGGFNGTDPAPTPARFQQYVREGRIHYFIGGGTGGLMGGRGGQGSSGSDDAQEISSWVQSNFTASTVGGTTVYDLTGS
ncbi:ArnT family glycosyltransferase [Actinomadura scrupuli]|uniref:ArnT family glycosyltransferase n=1 Tax=Actinomadura scrupuli TaxID=559629 RepID=UPI003D97D250